MLSYLGSCTNKTGNEKSGSRLGGHVCLPPSVEHPCDKTGKPLMLVAQVNFAELPASEIDRASKGLLMIFWNSARDHSNPKDRHAFRCIWIADPIESEFVESGWQETINAIGDSLTFQTSQQSSGMPPDSVQVFGVGSENFTQLQEIAAFAGNGVHWSPARSVDSCFSHLKEVAAQWKLLCRISSNQAAGLDLASRSLYLLLREEDMQSKNYEKAWLLIG